MTYSHIKFKKMISITMFYVLFGFGLLNLPASIMVGHQFGSTACWTYMLITTLLFAVFGLLDISGWVLLKIATQNSFLATWALMLVPIAWWCLIPTERFLPTYIDFPLAAIVGFCFGLVTAKFVLWAKIADVDESQKPEGENK